MFTRPLQVLLPLAFGVLLLAGCASPPSPAPKPVMIQYDRCGGNVRNPMGLPSDVAVSVAMNDPTAYAKMIVDWYEKHPECRGVVSTAPAPPPPH